MAWGSRDNKGKRGGRSLVEFQRVVIVVVIVTMVGSIDMCSRRRR